MSFGPSNTTKTGMNDTSGAFNTAVNQQLPMFNQLGSGALGTGGANVTSGTNFLNTLLNGNQANTAAALQPGINEIRSGVNNALTGVNTLAPRGGGRSSANYALSFAPQSQIQTLFNNARTGAASALPQIGLAQQGIGSGLLGMGNQALQTGTGAANNLTQAGLQQQQISNSLAGGLGGGLASMFTSLATSPYTWGSMLAL